MSKRAEELARNIDRDAVPGIGKKSAYYGSLDVGCAAALIDDFARKERERCAEKLTLWPVGEGHSQEYRNGYMSAINRCAAILSEADE